MYQSYDDVMRLLQDLDTLSEWVTTWLMTFNLSKCEPITVDMKLSPLIVFKNQDHNILCNIQQWYPANYLLITITCNLSWSNYIPHIYKDS